MILQYLYWNTDKTNTKMKNNNNLRWELCIQNVEMSSFQEVISFIETCLSFHKIYGKNRKEILIAVDEIYSNICLYSKAKECKIVYQGSLDEVMICFSDNGIGFDVLKKEDPDTSKTLTERKIGGLGIYIVKSTMDSLSYAYRPSLEVTNQLTIRKNIGNK